MSASPPSDPPAPSSAMPPSSISRPSTPTSLPSDLSIPNFAEQGITRSKAILFELNHGPTVAIYVGPNGKKYTLAKRLLIYRSPNLKSLLTDDSSNVDSLTLRHGDAEAFNYVFYWLTQDDRKLDVLSDYITSGAKTDTGLAEACVVLCRIFYFLCEDFEIEGMQEEMLGELKAATERARDEGMKTPVTSALVMEVWKRVGEASPLWCFLLDEVCVAYSSNKKPSYTDFEECWQSIKAFQKAVVETCIVGPGISGQSDVGKSQVTKLLDEVIVQHVEEVGKMVSTGGHGVAGAAPTDVMSDNKVHEESDGNDSEAETVLGSPHLACQVGHSPKRVRDEEDENEGQDNGEHIDGEILPPKKKRYYWDETGELHYQKRI